MPRSQPTIDTIKPLFARSGNQCAFPGCKHPVVNNEHKPIAQICHIEAAQKGGVRYNPESSEEYRRSYENLLILCYAHHKETDDVEKYPVDVMVGMKNEHEQRFEKSPFAIDESELAKIVRNMEDYWNEIKRLNKEEHVVPDLAVDIKGGSDFSAVIDDANKAVDGIESMLDSLHSSDKALHSDFESLLDKKRINKELFYDIPYYKHPFMQRNWEVHNLGVNNWLTQLRISLVHAEVKYWEEYLKTHNNDFVAKTRFEKVKNILKEYARSAGYAD